jgi:DNA (cytosine-5)-methyltransferase 1
VSVYYNENDPFAASWLQELIQRGLIAEGDVDERSIADVDAADVRGYAQCHWFAGIGGWSYALRLAGWPDDEPVWTGSCPCQPFSAAGKGEGFADPRHLWPQWFRLVRECRPGVVFGEQVDKALQWLDLVSGDLEGEGYAIGAAIVGAHSVGAPHRRQRIYWVADYGIEGCGQVCAVDGGSGEGSRAEGMGERFEYSSIVGVALPDGRHSSAEGVQRSEEQRFEPEDGGAGSELGNSESGEQQRLWEPDSVERQNVSLGRSGSRSMDQPPGEGLALRTGGTVLGGQARGIAERPSDLDSWRSPEWLPCRDGKSRPTQPGLFPLAHGIPGRVGRLRGYGNAIVPQVAAEFIWAYLDVARERAGFSAAKRREMKIAENVAKRVGQQTVAVAGLWLRKMGDHAEMLAENPATGEWVLLVSTQIEGQFSHIYEPSGIVAKFGPNPSDPNPVIGRCLAFGHGLTDHAQNGFCRDWKPLSEIDND